MDRETKKAFGLIMGDLYEIKSLLKNVKPNKDILYGLKNGFEEVIDEAIDATWWISKDDVSNASKILNAYFKDSTKLAELKGYYDMEEDFLAVNIDRIKARYIMKYFYIRHQFTSVINKMDSSDSPQELRGILDERWDN